MSTYTRMLALTLTMMASGCDAVDDAGQADVGIKLRPGNGGSGGVYLNTSAIGNHMFSELDLTGALHDGVVLDAVAVKIGESLLTLDSVAAQDGELQGLLGDEVFAGEQLVGSVWTLTIVAGLEETPATMWISAANQDGDGVWHYVFQHEDAQGKPADLCAPDLDGSPAAVPLKDITVDPATGDMAARPDTLYLACTSGAVGKAISWGYAQWERTIPEFEGLVRLVRADYCGDGVSWTLPGSALQVLDLWGINGFVDASAHTEAVWGPDGALCLGERRAAGGAVTCGGAAPPVCAADASLATYGDAIAWTKVAP